MLDVKGLLKNFTQIEGVSGFEYKIAKEFVKEAKKFADDAWVEKTASAVAVKNPTQEIKGKIRKIIIDAHIDEIGLVVTKIEKEGVLRFSQIGGYDARILPGQEVIIHGKKKLKGVIGCIPPHMQPRGERQQVIPIDELFIDIGLSFREISKLVSVGDIITLHSQFVELKNNVCVNKAMDDRASIVTLLLILELLSKKSHLWQVWTVAASQEEVGGVGASTLTYKIAPEAAIAVDVTHGNIPGVSDRETFALDKGPVIALGPNIHPKIHAKLVETAKSIEIPYSIEPFPGRTPTDASVIQISRHGVPTGLVSIPLRYMHTSVESVCLSDIERAARLIAEFISNLENVDFDYD